MAIVKNIPDNYTVNVPLMTVNGNLVVLGSTTQIQSTNTNIWDNIVILNAGVTGTPTLNAGLTVDRGSSANVSLLWNETVQKWQITNDGSTYANIATITGSTGFLTSVSGDPSPSLGGNLNITGHTIYDTANNVTAYAGPPSSGKSGVFVDNINGTQQELVTKSAAIAYSIIFG